MTQIWWFGIGGESSVHILEWLTIGKRLIRQAVWQTEFAQGEDESLTKNVHTRILPTPKEF